MYICLYLIIIIFFPSNYIIFFFLYLLLFYSKKRNRNFNQLLLSFKLIYKNIDECPYFIYRYIFFS
uniref:Uncharacterized protein n=1 Tax=Lepeophtheirus salmonis TaxID=72036 RepID=A0A0K2TQP9_LEPSM